MCVCVQDSVGVLPSLMSVTGEATPMQRTPYMPTGYAYNGTSLPQTDAAFSPFADVRPPHSARSLRRVSVWLLSCFPARAVGCVVLFVVAICGLFGCFVMCAPPALCRPRARWVA